MNTVGTKQFNTSLKLSWRCKKKVIYLYIQNKLTKIHQLFFLYKKWTRVIGNIILCFHLLNLSSILIDLIIHELRSLISEFFWINWRFPDKGIFFKQSLQKTTQRSFTVSPDKQSFSRPFPARVPRWLYVVCPSRIRTASLPRFITLRNFLIVRMTKRVDYQSFVCAWKHRI